MPDSPPKNLGIINDTPYDLYVFAHKNLVWTAADLAVLFELLIVPLVNLIEAAVIAIEGIAFAEYMIAAFEEIIAFLRLLEDILIKSKIPKSLSKLVSIDESTRQALLKLGVLYLSAGDTRRGIAYDYETSWLEPVSKIAESNPFACDTTVHVLAIYNDNLMGYTFFNAHHKSTWRPNLLSIPRDDTPDEDRPWITGEVLGIIDEIQYVINLVEMVEKMINDYFHDLPWTYGEMLCIGLICPVLHKQRVEKEQNKYINAWKKNFSLIHNERQQYVQSKLNGTTVTLTDREHGYLLTRSEDQRDPNRLKRLRFKNKNDKEKDIFSKINLSKKSLSESGLKEFRDYNKNLLDFSSEMLSHPLINETIWKGLGVVLVMPKNPLRPFQTGYVEFYKETQSELIYGGTTAYLRGLRNATTPPLYQKEMFHVHIPSLNQTNPPKKPIPFKKNPNGNYIISQSFDANGKNPYRNNGMENKINNWCINVDTSINKYRLFTVGDMLNFVNLRLKIWDDSKNMSVNLADFEKFLVTFQESNITLFSNHRHPYAEERACTRMNIYITHHWPISNGQMNDVIGSAHMSQGSNTKFATDRFGYPNAALDLNGGWSQVPSGVFFETPQFSISLWIFPRKVERTSRILAFGNGSPSDTIEINLLNLEFYISKGSTWLTGTLSKKQLAENRWQFLTVTYDGSYLNIFIDANLTSSQAMAYEMPILTRAQNWFGKSPYSQDGYSFSYLDDIKFYNTSLDQAQIHSIMDNEKCSSNNPLMNSQSRAMQNFYCESNLNDLITVKMGTAQIYLSMTSHFSHDSVALYGFAKYFKHNWKEKLNHAEKLITYVLKRGGNVEMPSVPKPVNESKWVEMSPCEMVNIALEIEQNVNNLLLRVHNCGRINADHNLQDFLESEFLNDQIEDIKELSELLEEMERATKYIKSNGKFLFTCDGLGIHIIDKEL